MYFFSACTPVAEKLTSNSRKQTATGLVEVPYKIRHGAIPGSLEGK
jgi:hypothetical protein